MPRRDRRQEADDGAPEAGGCLAHRAGAGPSPHGDDRAGEDVEGVHISR